MSESEDSDIVESQQGPFDEPFRIEITDSLDLHAFRPQEVEAVTRVYLEEARKKGFRFVRIIHGKGIGVQREIVRKVLSETSFVVGYRSGDEFSGGLGATVVEITID